MRCVRRNHRALAMLLLAAHWTTLWGIIRVELVLRAQFVWLHLYGSYFGNKNYNIKLLSIKLARYLSPKSSHSEQLISTVEIVSFNNQLTPNQILNSKYSN